MHARLLVVRSAAALLLAAAALALPAGGCVSASESSVEARTTTIGRELQDLEDARDKGLLTEAEYQKKREQILDRR